MNMDNFAFPSQHLNGSGEPYQPADGLTKREYFAGIAMHAEFLSCGQSEAAALDLNNAAALNGQTVEQRIAVNAIAVADALLAELAK